ncbi:MAG: alpha-galactosidase [Clostridia bacterium]|nr:alpha-galactosidase [Clostridia bacterium]
MQQWKIDGLQALRLDSGVFSAQLTSVREDGVLLLTLALSADAPTVPEPVTLSFEQFLPDVFAAWTPDAGDDRFIRADWSETAARSRSACGAPVLCLHTQGGENRLTVSLSDAGEACKIACGVSEERAVYRFFVTFFTQLTAPLDKYTVQLRLDYRPVRYETSIGAARAWWDALYPPCRVPDDAREPLYSCWYSLHQNVLADDVLRECTLAATYGMKVVILDDGWQTEDNNRGYAYCGDWQLARKKIPDMAALSERIHALGMKFMIWYAVPFIGEKSANFRRFAGKYLDNNENLGCYTIDPRFAECRAFLVETYRTAVRDWRLDGLKLDFIDSFHLCENSSTDFDAMDCVSLEEAVQKLLAEICETLKADDPDFLIEFRQNYIGPVMRRFGNMLRAGDCPYSAGTNRRSCLALRLTSGATAVHSDMVMWNPAESAERAADQLTAILYAVPQISVRLETLPQDHLDMLRFYLDFWRAHREILLDGTLTADDPHNGYSRACAVKDGTAVVTVWSRQDASLCGFCRGAVVNAAGEPFLLLQSDTAHPYVVRDCAGRELSRGTLPTGTVRLDVPHSGIVFFDTVG